jgi:hypothetical protein
MRGELCVAVKKTEVSRANEPINFLLLSQHPMPGFGRFPGRLPWSQQIGCTRIFSSYSRYAMDETKVHNDIMMLSVKPAYYTKNLPNASDQFPRERNTNMPRKRQMPTFSSSWMKISRPSWKSGR